MKKIILLGLMLLCITLMLGCSGDTVTGNKYEVKDSENVSFLDEGDCCLDEAVTECWSNPSGTYLGTECEECLADGTCVDYNPN